MFEPVLGIYLFSVSGCFLPAAQYPMSRHVWEDDTPSYSPAKQSWETDDDPEFTAEAGPDDGESEDPAEDPAKELVEFLLDAACPRL